MSDAMMELRKLVVLEAIWGDATWRAAASAALSQMDELRTLLGANEWESSVDALHRYTFAVQLGCALKLEQRAKEIAAEPPLLPVDKIREVTVAALIGGATHIRQGVPADIGQQPDALARWREAMLTFLADAWVEKVLPEWWERFMGGLPHEGAKEALREALLTHRPE